MGVFAFLTASKLKIELNRQRDEIARLHHLQDTEVTNKLKAEQQAEEYAEKNQLLEEECSKLREELEAREKAFQKERANLKKKFESESQKIQEEKEKGIHEMEIRLSTLRQELEDKQRQRSEATEQNARLAEKIAHLETTVAELTVSLERDGNRIRELEKEKTALEGDLNKIMGNLTRW